MSYAATIPSRSLHSQDDDDEDDDDVVVVSSLDFRVADAARGDALREISVYRALDDDRLAAGGHWSPPPPPPSPSTPSAYSNLSRGGAVYGDGMSADELKKDDADWSSFHAHQKRRVHNVNYGTRRRGSVRRRTTSGSRRRSGRHVKQKQSFNDVWDYELDELKMPTSCSQLQCSGSARCVIDERTHHARCRCPLGTTGIYCEKGEFFFGV